MSEPSIHLVTSRLCAGEVVLAETTHECDLTGEGLTLNWAVHTSGLADHFELYWADGRVTDSKFAAPVVCKAGWDASTRIGWLQ